MTLEISDYLANQLNGPIVRAMFQSAWDLFESDESLIDYWNSLSLDSATGELLDFIGEVLGIPRPIVTANNFFRFGYIQYRPVLDGDAGFGGLSVSGGGVLYSTSTVEITGTKVDDVMYRDFIKALSPLRHSLSTINLLNMAYSLTDNASITFAYDTNKDIQLLIGSTVSMSVVDLIQQVCDYYFATAPQVFVQRAPVSTDELTSWYTLINTSSNSALDEVGRIAGIHRPMIHDVLLTDVQYRVLLCNCLALRKDNTATQTYTEAIISVITSASHTTSVVTDTSITVIFVAGSNTEEVALVRDLLTFFALTLAVSVTIAA